MSAFVVGFSVEQFYDFSIVYFSYFCWFLRILKNTSCFLGFWPMVGLGWWLSGLPLGLVTEVFHWVFLALLVMGVQNILISIKPRFFIEFFHSSCVVLFLNLFLRRRATPWASDGSLWDAFVGPGLPCGLPVGRSGTTVLRFQHFLLFIILLIFMNS